MEKYLKFILLILTFFFYGNLCHSQDNTFEAVIIDSLSRETLPYAGIYHLQTKTGTASNREGKFLIKNLKKGDSIRITYLGYDDKIVVFRDKLPKAIYLKPNAKMLDEAIIVAKNDFIYELVAKVKRSRNSKSSLNKTYFYLESYLDQQPVEVVEAYYNGVYRNMKLEKMDLKKGRIAIRKDSMRHFSSTETSRLFTLFDCFEESKYFPVNPLIFNKIKIKKLFELSLDHVIRSGNSNIYVIDFKPKTKNGRAFSGKLYIDRNSNQLINVALNVDNSVTHPFLPFYSNCIKSTDLSLTLSFQSIENTTFVKEITYNYAIKYSDSEKQTHLIRSMTFIRSYDEGKIFELPQFEFTDFYSRDYRDITAVPYDTLFWSHHNEFAIKAKSEEINNLTKDHYLSGYFNFFPGDTTRKSQFVWPYRLWSHERIRLTAPSIEVLSKARLEKPYDRDRFNLDFKLYLDQNEIKDSLYFKIYAILDPVNSFYLFDITNVELAFINMYFDLLEIQKRKLLDILKSHKKLTTKDVTEFYNKAIRDFKLDSEKFIREVNRGKNKVLMSKWNAYIKKELGVDNLKIFGL